MKFIVIKKEKILLFIYVLLIIIGISTIFRKEVIETSSMPVSKKIITIDAGHGGWDPGKMEETTSKNKDEEKEINLQIALKLQKYLEQGGSTVIMTRATDEALGDKKSDDLKERIAISNEAKSDLLISIHQNAYPDEKIKGAQVFYFEDSKESKRLAETVQFQLKEFLDIDNHREAKSNASYYLLKKTKTPAVIVECGFISNPTELRKIKSDEYQEKIAWAIYKGIIQYYNGDDIL